MAIIDENDKIWNVFLGYVRLIDANATSSGLDIYGTEMRTTLSLGLTQAHMSEHVAEKLTAIEKLLKKERVKKNA